MTTAVQEQLNPKVDAKPHRRGALIINADDWGRDRETTDRTAECLAMGAISSVSAMVFMEDSQRAAALARKQGVDAGLHLNLTAQYSGSGISSRLAGYQARVAHYLRQNPLAQVIFHPGLARAFEYIVAVQIDEYRKLYDQEPRRIDGHHHMHLCANVVFAKLLPAGTLVRRNFSFAPGEKSWINRFYRNLLDKHLSKRHRLVDFLLPLAPVDQTARLQRIVALAQHSVVELETHPVNAEEYRLLMSGDILSERAGAPLAHAFTAYLDSPQNL